ncbi:MAG TPA: ATP-grasp domain-containing protein [Pirellulales bacterium]|nr:ATP-grasp domain-containing protein [Pirellulales bacterium]
MARLLNIVGASARGAAFSASAAGFEPACADLFADVDLQAVCAVDRMENYPSGLANWLHSARKAPWMYTGALENYPGLIDELARLRTLYGNSGRALRTARNPLYWSRALAESGIATPRISLSPVELPRDGSWMLKPLRSANGQHVAPWTAQVSRIADPSEGPAWYYQERIDGTPVAAVFVAADRAAAILGVTRQLLGGNWRAAIAPLDIHGHVHKPGVGAPPLIASATLDESLYRYTGSIGPLLISDDQFRTLERIGSVLTRACGLTGLFGVDAILNEQSVWPVEINPRYTASIEILERASALRTSGRRPRRLHSIECHEAACLFRQLPAPLGQSDEIISGKLIYYTPHEVIFSSAAARWAAERNLTRTLPAVADIPASGTLIPRGHPVLTVLGDGPKATSVCDELRQAAETLEKLLLAPETDTCETIHS